MSQDKGASTVTALIGVVSEAVDHCSRADVVSFLPQLSAFYLQALDYRGHALDKVGHADFRPDTVTAAGGCVRVSRLFS